MMTLDTPIFDAHSHAFPDTIAAGAIASLKAETLWEPVEAHHDGTVRGLIETMDRAGIKRTILCSIATRPTQVRKITDWSAAIACERIVPFASIHPDFEDVEAEAERIASLGLRGIKLHPQYMKCAADDPRMLRIARAAARFGLALTIHAGYDLSFPKDELASPRQILTLAESAPGLRVLACHMGGWERWEEVLDELAGQPVWLETSYALEDCPGPLLEAILANHPPEYLLFGTDSPWADQRKELELFMALPISDETKRLALWDNAERFLQSPSSRGAAAVGSP